MAIEDGSVSSADLTGVVQDNDLSVEGVTGGSGVVLGVGSDVTTANLLDGNVLDVETDVVTGVTGLELLVVHLNGLDFSGDVGGGEGDDHAGGNDTSLDTTDGNCANLGLLLPTLVPGAVGRGLKHVVAVEAGDGDEGNGLGVVADLLDEVGGLLDNLVVTLLGPLAGVHLVEGNDELLNTEGEGKQSVLTGLAILGDTSDHVLDEITVTGGICNEIY